MRQLSLKNLFPWHCSCPVVNLSGTIQKNTQNVNSSNNSKFSNCEIANLWHELFSYSSGRHFTLELCIKRFCPFWGNNGVLLKFYIRPFQWNIIHSWARNAKPPSFYGYINYNTLNAETHYLEICLYFLCDKLNPGGKCKNRKKKVFNYENQLYLYTLKICDSTFYFRLNIKGQKWTIFGNKNCGFSVKITAAKCKNLLLLNSVTY